MTPSTSGIAVLPEELLHEVSKHLDAKDVLAFAGTGSVIRNQLSGLLPASRVKVWAQRANGLKAFDAALAQLGDIADMQQARQAASCLFGAICQLPETERWTACEHLALTQESPDERGNRDVRQILEAISDIRGKSCDQRFFALLTDMGSLSMHDHAAALERLYKGLCILDAAALPEFTRLSSLLHTAPDGNHLPTLEMLGKAIARYPLQSRETAYLHLMAQARQHTPADQQQRAFAVLCNAIPHLSASTQGARYAELAPLQLRIPQIMYDALLKRLLTTSPMSPGWTHGQVHGYLLALMHGNISSRQLEAMVKALFADAPGMASDGYVYRFFMPVIFKLPRLLRDAAVSDIFNAVSQMRSSRLHTASDLLDAEIQKLPKPEQQQMITMLSTQPSPGPAASRFKHDFLARLNFGMLGSRHRDLMDSWVVPYWQQRVHSARFDAAALNPAFAAPTHAAEQSHRF